MSRMMIADERTGLRPLNNEPVLSGIFDGDTCGLRLENGCVIFDDGQPNYHTQDGREFAEVLELEDEADGVSGLIAGYVELNR
ncbi:hypothetical protein [Butyricicoccus sp.]|uniref:hypothetical protein n=1 Tax=Butyricicoccus sp. TaxID=2049021 RepID=UPI0037360886